MNIALLCLEIILMSASILVLYKYFKKDGLYFFIITSIILTNLMALKTTNILEIDVALGSILYVGIFIAINLIIQKYGIESIKKITITTICASTISIIIITLLTLFPNSPVNIETNISFNIIFNNNIRIFLASIITFIISIYINTNIYSKLRLDNNKIFVSNMVSMLITQFIDTILFMIIAFGGTISIKLIIDSIAIRLIIKYITSLIGTIIIYIGAKYE